MGWILEQSKGINEFANVCSFLKDSVHHHGGWYLYKGSVCFTEDLRNCNSTAYSYVGMKLRRSGGW